MTVPVPATILFITDAPAMRAEPDEQLVDAVHCIGHFNFINRVLDGLGVDPDRTQLPFLSLNDADFGARAHNAC